jgi:hypothetical protein
VLSVSLASGYQRFALSLAARLAIWRLARAPRADALVIDEGFGACDDEYLASLAGALEALATAPGAPRLIFVVSHVDALKDRVERALEITRHATPAGTSSRIANVAVAPGAATAAPAAPAPGAELPIDPTDNKKRICTVCATSIGASAVARHLGSEKHAAATRKAARQAGL